MKQTIRMWLAILVPPALLGAAAYLAIPHTALPWWQVLAGALVAAVSNAWHRYQESPAARPSSPDKLRAGGALFVACAVAGSFCSMLAFAALLPGCQLPPDRAARVAACKAGVEQCLTDAKLMAGTKEEQMAAYERCRDKVHVACLGPEPSAAASTSATPSAAPSAAASVAP